MDRHAAHNRPMVEPRVLPKVLPKVLVVMGVSSSARPRWVPWLRRIADRIDAWRSNGEAGVITCSALKRAYREVIIGDRPDVGLVHLRGLRELIGRRMAARKGHFMPTALLDNQFATFQEPSPEERAITVDVGGTPTAIVDDILRRLRSELKREPA